MSKLVDPWFPVEEHGFPCDDLDPPHVADFPRLTFSKKDVQRAGEALKADMTWTPEADEKIKDVFRIANSWRDSHLYPMQRLRYGIIGMMNGMGLHGRLTAARLKRMPSIRKKLRLIAPGLDQMQDIAGVRVILPNMRSVETIVAACRERLPHTLRSERNYIALPKESGYRCHHLMYAFTPDSSDQEHFTGRRVEIQVRTRLQHAWATAVEAVGMWEGYDFKGGRGDTEWLRLFALMASEIAHTERQPELPGAPARNERLREILDLNRKLDAAAKLDQINQAVRFTDLYRAPKSQYFLVTYDRQERTVDVRGFDAPIMGTASYDRAEERGDRYDTVLVDADQIGRLKEAYPNYFGDVQLFIRALRNVVKGKDAEEYVLPPQETVAQVIQRARDPGWRRTSTQRPDERLSGDRRRDR